MEGTIADQKEDESALRGALCSCCLAKDPANSRSVQVYAHLLKKCFQIKVSKLKDSIICSSCSRRLKRLKAFRDQVKKAQSFIMKFKYTNEDSKRAEVNKFSDKCSKEEYKELPLNTDSHDTNESCSVLPREDGLECAEIYENHPNVHENKEDVPKKLRRTKTEKRLPYNLDRNSRRCPICGLAFVFFKELTDHVPSHFPSHICDTCGKLCATQLSLTNHIKSHSAPKSKCEVCGKQYKRPSSLQNHMAISHKGQKNNYKCPECLETFVTFHGRIVHLISVHGREEKRYKCTECPKRYNHGSHLRAHIRNEHRKEKNAQCEVCNFMFFNKSALRKHLVSHSKEKKHQCVHCSKCFPRKSALNLHLKIHTNEKAFVCPICGRAFTQKVSLKKHSFTHEKMVASQDTINSLSNMLRKL